MTAGRKPGPIAAPFAHMPRHEAVVYICELSDGSVKVGYSFQPRQRFTMMARQLAGQKPAGYDHLGHALRTVRHSGEGRG